MVKKKESKEDVLDKELREMEDFDDTIFDDVPIGGNKSEGGMLIEDDTFDDFDTKIQSQDAEGLKIFLETETFLNRMKLGLENKEKRSFKMTGSDGSTKSVSIIRQIKDTEPLANAEGISQIMGRAHSIISKDISLGNIDWLRYDKFMQKFKTNFITQLVIHAKDWDIASSKIKPIYDIVSEAVELYLTRPVGDKERGIFGGKDHNPTPTDNNGLGSKLSNMFNRSKGRK